MQGEGARIPLDTGVPMLGISIPELLLGTESSFVPLAHAETFGKKEVLTKLLSQHQFLDMQSLSAFTEHRPAASAAFRRERQKYASAGVSERFMKPFTGISVILFDLVKNQRKQLHP